MKKSWIIIIVFILLTTIGSIYWFNPFKFSFIPNYSAKSKEKTAIVKKGTISQSVTISGEIDAEQKTVQRFPLSGILNWVGVKKGDTVKRNQSLASLDQKELQKRLEKYLYAYQKSRWDFDQTKDEFRQPAQNYWGMTWDQRNDIDRVFQKAQFDLSSSVLDVEIQKITLDNAFLYSPIDGIVTNVTAPFPGTNITPSQAEFEIINPSSIYLSILADQNEVTSMHTGMTCSVKFDPFPDQTFHGTVTYIAYTPKSGESGTVYGVSVSFPDATASASLYRLGMTGDATFTLKERRDVLTVPSSAIHVESDKRYVNRKVQGNAVKTFIEVGLEDETHSEILSGVAEGDVLYD